MVMQYLNWVIGFFKSLFAWSTSVYVVDGVSLLGFIGAVSLLCIIIGMILIH